MALPALSEIISHVTILTSLLSLINLAGILKDDSNGAIAFHISNPIDNAVIAFRILLVSGVEISLKLWFPLGLQFSILHL